jgi:hypothetical protein
MPGAYPIGGIMCFSSDLAKILDPGGFIAEKTTPKAFAPYSGLHGTSKAMRALQAPIPPSPLTTSKPAQKPAQKPASQKLLGE